ncbi:MAG: hypothetical protein MPN21_25255 [Thermoanaerobaculia bacterium]|nr:hypothetical protein [Thermoanaerobaculia bacterium]
MTNETRYPVAKDGSQTDTKGTVACGSCAIPLQLGRWERWNGFLVECPSCGCLHGKSRALRNVAMAGLLFNVLSFWFLMRPKSALLWTLVFGSWVLGGVLLLPKRPSDATMLLFVGFLLLGPVVVSVVSAARHESLLFKPAHSST